MESQQSNKELLEEYKEYRFQKIEKLSEEIWLVRDRTNGLLYRCRTIEERQKKIYALLDSITDYHLPKMIVLTETNYIMEEYINGINLKDMQQLFSEYEVKEMLKQLLPTLKKIHKKGIIHRDIKPSNIVKDFKGRYYLVDFDIAIIKSEEGEVQGTAEYAPPEQYGYDVCDERSDIYSLGILINILLTGKLPKEKIVSGGMGKIVKKCIHMERKERYKNVSALSYAIDYYFLKSRIYGIGILIFLCILAEITGKFYYQLQKKEVEDISQRTVKTIEDREQKQKTENRENGINKEEEKYYKENIKAYGIVYRCLLEMNRLKEKKEIIEIKKQFKEKTFLEKYGKKELALKKIYYKTKQEANIYISLFYNEKNKTGYDFFENYYNSREEIQEYNEVSINSYCCIENETNDKILFHAGARIDGVWMLAEILCFKDELQKYKEYLKEWIHSIERTENNKIREWKRDWKYFEKKCYNFYTTENDRGYEYLLDIDTVSENQIIFSFTEINSQDHQKKIETTGLIYAWMEDDLVAFTANWKGKIKKGYLFRSISKKVILMIFAGNSFMMKLKTDDKIQESNKTFLSPFDR